MERIDSLAKNPFLDGPAEFLVKTVVDEIGKVPQWKLLFGDQIDPYLRMDYGLRALPALRVYNRVWRKTSDNAWIVGDLLADVIFPASRRRAELQQVQDTVSAALLQQFRRNPFFAVCLAGCPGLNELGREISCDKSLGFLYGDDVVPLTQLTINFRLDLRKWDDYLEQTNRVSDDPFEETLANLTKIVTTIKALTTDDGTTTDPQAVQTTMNN